MSDNRVVRFIDILSSFNLRLTISEPTRVTRNSSTLIDNIITNSDNYNSAVINTALSDHKGQKIMLPVWQCGYGNDINRKTRSFNRHNLDIMEEEISTIPWTDLWNSDDVNNVYNHFQEVMLNVIDNVAPSTTERKDFSKKWLTTELRNKCGLKRQLYEGMIQNKINKQTYDNYADHVAIEIKKAKEKYNSNFILNSRNKVKATWTLVKEITNSKKSSYPLTDTIKPKIIMNNKREILNYINDYFINVCMDTNQVQMEYNTVTRTDKTFFMTPTDTIEVRNIINDLKDTPSTGYDEIPVSLLKRAAPTVAEPLAEIINRSILAGIFPDLLKRTVIRPIHKKGDKSQVSNYRPIALISNVAKIFEKVIHKRINNFLTKENLLTENQNGYQREKSTYTAIYQIITEILDGINSKEEVAGIFMDLSKAFDSVKHDILLEKLYCIGIRGNCLELMKSYLRGRRQCVADIGDDGRSFYSDWATVKKGIPQGTILGPLLFLIYLNDLPGALNYFISLFADDATLTLKYSNMQELRSEIPTALDAVEEWFEYHNLKLNIDKTNIVRFTTSQKDTLRIKYKDTELISVHSTMFLGLKVDSLLNWKDHIDELVRRLSPFSFALQTIVTSVSQEAALSAYYAYIESRLRYGIVFWGNSVDASRLFVFQKRCIRKIFNLKTMESCREVFRKNKIHTLTNLYILECSMFVRKNRKTFFDKYILKHEYDTRGTRNTYLAAPQTTIHQVHRNIVVQVIKVFNHIPPEVHNLSDKCFKKTLVKHLHENSFYSVNDFFSYVL